MRISRYFKLKQTTSTTATRTSQNKGLMSKKNSRARAL